MNKDKNCEKNFDNIIKEKLEKIIERSHTENEALKKILAGLEKMNKEQTKNLNKK